MNVARHRTLSLHIAHSNNDILIHSPKAEAKDSETRRFRAIADPIASV